MPHVQVAAIRCLHFSSPESIDRADQERSIEGESNQAIDWEQLRQGLEFHDVVNVSRDHFINNDEESHEDHCQHHHDYDAPEHTFAWGLSRQ